MPNRTEERAADNSARLKYARPMPDDRIMMKNANTGRDGTRIRVAIYEPVRDAILAALDDADSLVLAELGEQVEARTDPEIWANASVMWYTMTVKLHLEAIGLLTKSGSPQQHQLTDLGRKELAKSA